MTSCFNGNRKPCALQLQFFLIVSALFIFVAKSRCAYKSAVVEIVLWPSHCCTSMSGTR